MFDLEQGHRGEIALPVAGLRTLCHFAIATIRVLLMVG
jgi:hypothetical protein